MGCYIDPLAGDEALAIPGLTGHAVRRKDGTIEVWCEDWDRRYFHVNPELARRLEAADCLAITLRFAFTVYEEGELMGEKSGQRDMQYKFRALLGIPDMPSSRES